MIVHHLLLIGVLLGYQFHVLRKINIKTVIWILPFMYSEAKQPDRYSLRSFALEGSVTGLIAENDSYVDK